MLGHFGGKLCHRERGRCLARHQIGAGKFGEYTHFIETYSTGRRDILGHSRGKL